MKIILYIFMFIFLIFADDRAEIGFRYGLIGQAENYPDINIELSDSSVIYTGDRVQVNIGILSASSFLLIFKGSKNKFKLLYEYPEKDNVSSLSILDTTYKIALSFTRFTDPPGVETFYFINSYKSQTELIKLINRYSRAPDKAKIKIAKRIQSALDSLDPTIKSDISSMQSRLDKPMVGGVSFRGEEDGSIHDMSVTHECIGIDGIAFKKIILNHLVRR